MDTLSLLRGGLVVSCQPVEGGPMDRPDIVAAMAEAAVAGGAAGVRIEGLDNLAAVRPRVAVPIIALVKRDRADTPVRITPDIADVEALAEAGADIIAYDATPRPRRDNRDAVLAAILASGMMAMADCATEADGRHALERGATILGTTLSGYTDETAALGDRPDYDLVRAFHGMRAFVMAEGRCNTPDLAAAAIRAGADCVTVGSAVTRLEHVVGWFAAAVAAVASPDPAGTGT